ncbi:DinB family protein [Glycomyces albidus]|uniref:DUF664 domain-containing protein n=1 Tax=Glycomyces albidus TaxID=2656774 RepID=A0A6L5G7D3_9ACTN|nr:DinB family protein [Glycomyces albidus]MQM25521.1 DUF664 domain-containing protein [Glycomyces albidus]
MTPEQFPDPGVRPRTEPPGQAGERETLLGFLRWQRETFAWKCAGLSPERLASRSVAPSGLSLLGLVRHLADVERGWVRGRIAGDVSEPLYWRVDDNDADFNEAVGTPECVEQAWAAFWEAAAFTDRFVPAAPSLDVTCDDSRRGTLSLRWVLLHLIDEYARHNGHADLLRERIDGAVGR